MSKNLRTRFYQHIVSRTEDFVVDVEAKHVGVKGLLCFLPRDVHVLLGMSALQQVTCAATPKNTIHFRELQGGRVKGGRGSAKTS